MKQETKRLSSIIIAAAILAVALVIYFAFIVPAYANLETVKGQEESEMTLYSNEHQIVTQGKTLLSTYESDASSTQVVDMALPVGQNVAGALAQIYGIAINSGVVLQGTGISVQAVQATTPPGSGITGAAAAGSIIKPTGTVSFQASGSGSYEAFKNFLKGLETNIRIFDVQAISLEPSQIAATKTQAANQDEFNFSITVVTYYQAAN